MDLTEPLPLRRALRLDSFPWTPCLLHPTEREICVCWQYL